MEKIVKVVYLGLINLNLDQKIKKTMENNGFKWYIEGEDISVATGERDLAFVWNGEE